MKTNAKIIRGFLVSTSTSCLLVCTVVGNCGALAKTKEVASTQNTLASEADAQMPVYEEGKKMPKGMAESSVSVNIASAPENVWNALTSFENYPKIFKRIKTSEITKTEGTLVYLETYLKPQRFVKNQVQHTITNIADSPRRIAWKQIDGNFKHVDGTWDLSPVDGGKTKLTYTLHVDSGTIVPPPLVSFFLKFVQNEVVNQLKQYIEANEKAERKKAKAQ